MTNATVGTFRRTVIGRRVFNSGKSLRYERGESLISLTLTYVIEVIILSNRQKTARLSSHYAMKMLLTKLIERASVSKRGGAKVELLRNSVFIRLQEKISFYR